MLRFKNVSYITLPPRNIKVFDNVSFEIPLKQNTVIYGENGKGKTTLVNLMMKFIEPASGVVEGGYDKAACMFEDLDSQIFFSTVYEEFKSVVGAKNICDNNIITQLDLKNLLNRSTFELSYSQKARLILALAYLSEREFLILDCPPDDEKIDLVINNISQKKERTVIVFIPEGSERKLSGEWNKYLIRDNGLHNVH